MKKLHFTVLYIIIFVLSASLVFTFKLLNDKPKEKMVYITQPIPEDVLVSKPIPNSEKPAIPVEPYLIQQYCQKNIMDNDYDSSFKNWDKTILDQDVMKQGLIAYNCKKNTNDSLIVDVLCSKLFNPKMFLGKSTINQKNCIFEAK